ncbi:TonB-dependent receptor [Emcibacter nanhaiensis]|uniref:TonB-dependent receptor n=1 Tax=Emcibacter nanhaiensis TaxID=1505037 RepID=A0A501PAA6_9PROT|nr:TonB-dependent receptor [Emcibacter nanhaiensis]TPD56854.1 hypothetical protein FIV46_17955 [Emcibacter nanhaiensis]
MQTDVLPAVIQRDAFAIFVICFGSGAENDTQRENDIVKRFNSKSELLGTISKIALLTGLSASLGTMAAAAQDAEDEVIRIDEVVVTASRRAQSLEEVPYNISAATGEALKGRNVVDFAKLTRTFAGLQMTDRGVRDNTASARLISRGLNTESAAFSDLPFVTASPVATYVGETPVFANLRMNDIDRVEFLRGPQGTLYGSGSLGGTLRFIHNNPDSSEFYGRVEGSTGFSKDAGDPNYSVSGVLNVPLSENTAVRVSGGHDYYAGYIDGLTKAVLDADDIAEPADPDNPFDSAPLTKSKKDINEAKVTYAHAALRVELGENWTIQVNSHYQKEKGANRDAQSVMPGEPERTNLVLLDEPSERELKLIGLDVEADFGFATMTSSSSYTDVDSSAITDGTGAYGSIGYLFFPRVTVPLELYTSSKTFVQEVRLVSNSDGPLSWLIGGFYMDQDNLDLDEFDYFRGDSLIGFPISNADELFLNLHRESNFEDLAAFGELRYDFSEQWQVTVGARVFNQKFSSEAFFDFPAFGLYPGSPNSFEEDGVLFKVNTSYQWSDAANVYATFSQGFRRGGANSIPTSGPLAEPAELVSYSSDSVDNYEIGVKGVFENNVRYSLALYYIDWKDAQIGTLSPVFGYDVGVNGGDAESKGLEAEISGPIGENFNFSIGYSYTDSSLKDGFDGFVSGQAGARLPGVSKHSLSAALDYVLPLSNAADLVFHVDGSYRSDFVNNVDRTLDIYREFDGFAIFAASVSYQTDTWHVTLAAENLFDEKAISAQNDPGYATPDYVVEWGTRPRTVTLSFASEF